MAWGSSQVSSEITNDATVFFMTSIVALVVHDVFDLNQHFTSGLDEIPSVQVSGQLARQRVAGAGVLADIGT